MTKLEWFNISDQSISKMVNDHADSKISDYVRENDVRMSSIGSVLKPSVLELPNRTIYRISEISSDWVISEVHVVSGECKMII